MRASSMPADVRNAFTDSARFFDSLTLKSRLPSFDVWPDTSMRRAGYSLKTFTASLSNGNDDALMSAELRRNVMPRTAPVNFLTATGSSSGQPSSSWKPFFVSGSIGHLSFASATPSLSLSGSGQPSSSSKPSLSSASSGHLSVTSGMPSLSLSGSGQPSSSSKPSRSSGTVGHLSSLPMIPSPSGSRLGGGGITTTSFFTTVPMRSISPKFTNTLPS